MNYDGIVDKLKFKKVICFGASDAAEKFFELMPLLEIHFFVDNNVRKHGSLFLNKPVCSPDILTKINKRDYFLIITSSYTSEIKIQLQKLGLVEEEHFCNIIDVKNSLNLNLHFENGHYYSPIPNINEIREKEEIIFLKNKQLSGIEINETVQNDLFWTLSLYINEFFQLVQKKELKRYYLNNGFFEFFDAATLYGILSMLQPQKIIEVGSGFSSSVMLDTKDILNLNTQFTFVEPYPDRLNILLTAKDKKESRVIVSKVQDVPLIEFQKLGAGDILFIDSSHVSKIGSDVNYLLFDVIPNLKPGVIIHFHDIFYPFEYPKEWLYKGFYWNEAYLLKSFLQFNEAFSIMYWNDFIYQKRLSELKEEYLILDQSFGGGLWLKKNK